MGKLHSERLIRKTESGIIKPKRSIRLRFMKDELLFKKHFKAILNETEKEPVLFKTAESFEGNFAVSQVNNKQIKGTFKGDNKLTPGGDVTNTIGYSVSPVGFEIQSPLQSTLLKDVKELQNVNNGALIVGEGSAGEYVGKIQEALNDLFWDLPNFGPSTRIDPIEQDNIFGPKTKIGVLQFQKRWGLTQKDGIVGQETIKAMDDALLSLRPKVEKPDPAGEVAKDWKKLIAFKPGKSTYDELKKRASQSAFNGPFNRWDTQEIEHAKGEKLNLDLYCMNVIDLPTIAGKKVTAEELQEYIRTHLNDFFDQSIAEFSSYSDSDEEKWQSKDPLNSVMHFDIHAGPQPLKTLSMVVGGPDDLSVITSEYTKDHWIFTTAQSPGDWQHPVSGHRKFGYKTDPNKNFVFYVTGTDRVTGEIDTWVEDSVFEGGHKKWLAYQKNVVNFINSNGGKAQIGITFSQRVSWAGSAKLLDDIIAGK
jgi:hypothetical protein